MHSTVNQRGGYHKTITVSQNHSATAQVMLKNSFLKDTSKYILQIGQFFTSSASHINTFAEDPFHFKIRRLEPSTSPLNGPPTPMPDYYDPKDYTFRGSFFTVTEFVDQLQRFFHKFGFMQQHLGVTVNEIGDLPSHLVVNKNTAPVNFFRDFDEEKAGGGSINVGWVARVNQSNLVNASVDSDGHLKFILSSKFADNFFIEVSPNMQTVLGLPRCIYQYTDEDDDIFNDTNYELLVVPENAVPAQSDIFRDPYIPEREPNVQVPGQPFYIKVSDHSIRGLDTRLSLDVGVDGIHLSNKISSQNGKETHEHLLARFWLADYKEISTENLFSDTQFLPQMRLTETTVLGLQDLTRGNQGCETNYLKPGPVQFIRVRLDTRYLENGVVSTYPTKMDAGYFTLKLVFIKKV